MDSISANDAADGADARRALVVVGMHRSGTSAMARTLSLLGAALPKGLMPAVQNNNDAGFWEPQSVADLNDEILHAVDSEWDDVFAFRPREYLSNFDNFYLGRATELLQQEFAGEELIVLKDPRISVLSSFWDRALRRAGYSSHYIIMVRNPLEVAESLRARDGFPREKSLLLWSSYMVGVDRDTRGKSRTFVSYDQLMNSWRVVRKRIEHDVGFPFPRDTAAASLEIDRHLQRKLRHHVADDDNVYASDEVPEQTKLLYRIFLNACEGMSVDAHAVDAVQAELAKFDQLMGPLLADLKARSQILEKEVDSQRKHAECLIADHRQESAKFEARLADEQAQRENGFRELAELRSAHSDLKSAHSDLKSAHAELQRLSRDSWAALEELRGQHAAVVGQLEAERAKAAEDRQAVADAQKRLEQLDAQLAALSSELHDEREISAAAKVEASALEHRLTERSSEMSRLIDLLSERDAAEKRSSADADWLRQASELLLADGNTRKGRWYRLLPAALNYKRQLKLLRRKGLFDAASYLEANPDIVGAVRDPLRHYIVHGLKEQRARRR